jgi:phosphoribosylanthranilate isomerase
VSLFVKVCGITDHVSAEAAASSGVDAIGFVFAASPRQVTPRVALSIAGELPPEILRVAVFRRPRNTDIDRVLDEFTPDLVQADHNSLNGFAAVATLPVFRDGIDETRDAPAGFRASNARRTSRLMRENSGRSRFLYEGPVSGAGQLVDLSRAASVARLGDMVLAGGLRPDNVGRVIPAVRPFGVDVSSGVESSPGIKDPALIRSFVTAARAAEERLVNA